MSMAFLDRIDPNPYGKGTCIQCSGEALDRDLVAGPPVRSGPRSDSTRPTRLLANRVKPNNPHDR
jgi:hypothetical protein